MFTATKLLVVAAVWFIAVGEQSSLGEGHNESAQMFKTKHFQLY